MESETKKFSIKLEGPGITLDQIIQPEIARRIILLIVSEGKVRDKDSSEAGGGLDEEETNRSIKASTLSEYFRKYNAKRNTRKITVIGFYLKNIKKVTQFKKEDLLKGFENADEPTPKNIIRDINLTIKAGWIASKLGQKDTYYITSKGIEALNKGFRGK